MCGVNDHYPTGPPQWNPSLEAWPGGPNPGAIVAAIEEEKRRGQMGQAQAAVASQARRRRVNHLLLHR